jgi:O-antigen/teichoic acid export membrane protein
LAAGDRGRPNSLRTEDDVQAAPTVDGDALIGEVIDAASGGERGPLFRVGHGFRLRNAAIYVVSNGLQRGATVLVAPILLARLSVSEYGIYALLLTIYTLGPAFLSLGLYGAINRFYFDGAAASDRHRTMSSLLLAHAATIVLITSALDAGLRLSVGAIAGIPDLYFELILWASAAAALYEGPAGYWRAAERPLTVAVAGIASVCATTGAMTAFLFLTPLGLKGVLIGLGVGQGAVSLTMLVLVLREVGLAWHRGALAGAFAFSLPLIPHFVSNWLLRASDRWILDHFRTTAEVGAYFLGVQLTSLISLVMFSTNDAIGPRFLARYRDGGAAAARAFHARLFPLYLLSSSALAAGAILLGPLAAAIVSHGKVTHISLVMSLLAGGFVASTLYVPFANAFFALKRTSRLFLLTMSSAAVSVAFNLALIPVLGSLGAGTSLLLAYGFLLAVTIVAANRLLGLRPFVAHIAAAAAALGALTWFAQAVLYR